MIQPSVTMSARFVSAVLSVYSSAQLNLSNMQLCDSRCEIWCRKCAAPTILAGTSLAAWKDSPSHSVAPDVPPSSYE